MSAEVKHIFCEGRARGLTFDCWLHGDRVGIAWWNADYARAMGWPT